MGYDKTKWEPLLVPLTPDEHQRLRALAHDHDRSIAAMARDILRRAVRPAKTPAAK